MNTIRFYVVLALIAAVSCTSPERDDITVLVDPFIGTAAHGHVFPGATTPSVWFSSVLTTALPAGTGARDTIIQTQLLPGSAIPI